MPSPSLVIRRLIVTGELNTDLKFGKGINIIKAITTANDPRSTNKSGKTALIELIQHGLGRRQPSKAKFHFAPIIDQVDKLWLEFEANNQIFTMERSLQAINARARLREGSFVYGIENTPFENVPVEEISDVLLRVLSIPNVSVKTADGSLFPLTFPTLMRAFILHQEDSFGAILDKVLPEQRRADIIGFLTKITPLERFTVEDRLAEVQTELMAKETYFSSVQEFLTKNGIVSILEADAKLQEAENALQTAKTIQRNIQQEIREKTDGQPSERRGRLDILRQRLLEFKEQAAQLERVLIGLRQEEARVSEVYSSLEVDRQKAQRIFSSSTILSSVEFNICPRCLLEITPEMRQREQFARCSLCNRPLRVTSDTPPRTTPQAEDIIDQIQEAENILRDLRNEISATEIKLRQIRGEEASIGKDIDEETKVFVSPAVDHLLEKAHEVAQKEAELARANALYEQTKALVKIKDELNELRDIQAGLQDKLRESRKPNRTQLEKLRQIYENILIQVDFPDFRNCTIDPHTLMPSINGDLYVHTGTALKGLATVAYHLALLELSRQGETYFPRILVIDSPAVGDLNDENHDRLLRYLSNLQSHEITSGNDTEQNTLNWQIILTTRRTIPQLDPYIIEEVSSPGRMLLRKRENGKSRKSLH